MRVEVDWRDRQVSAGEAVSVIKPGDTVFVGTACATPMRLVRALEARAVPGVTLVHFITTAPGDTSPDTSYRHRVFYIGTHERALRDGAMAQIDYVPVSLSDVPRMFRNGQLALDVALLQVAAPEADGTCSLGISVDVSRAAALSARTVIAEVNPAMPRTAGDSRIPTERIDRFVAVADPVLEYLHEPTGGAAEQIARYAARLIEDRSTLQVGLVGFPTRCSRT